MVLSPPHAASLSYSSSCGCSGLRMEGTLAGWRQGAPNGAKGLHKVVPCNRFLMRGLLGEGAEVASEWELGKKALVFCTRLWRMCIRKVPDSDDGVSCCRSGPE